MAKENLPGGSDGKETSCNAGDPGSDPGLGRSPGEGNGYPFQYSCLKNSMDHGAWWGYSLWGRKESDMTERHFHFQEWLLKQSLGTKRGQLVAWGERSQFSIGVCLTDHEDIWASTWSTISSSTFSDPLQKGWEEIDTQICGLWKVINLGVYI